MADKKSSRRTLFWKLIMRAIIRRRAHLVIMLFSIIIGITIVSAMTNIYQNLGDKLSQQFRQYGANVVVKPRQGINLNQKQFKDLAGFLGESVVAYSSFDYSIVKRKNQDIIVAGTNLSQLPSLYPYWKLKGAWPKEGSEVAVGKELATKLGLKPGQTLFIKDNGRKSSFFVKAIFESGSTEDSQIFASQSALDSNIISSVGYLSIIGQGEVLKRKLNKAKKRYSDLKIEPISRLASTETKVLGRIKYLVWLVAVIILITSVLAVTTTLTAIVIERRKEIALKKAIGAQNKEITKEFLGESLVLGLTGGIIGWFGGFFLASWISRVIFNSVIIPSAISFFLALIVAIAVSLLAAAMPLRLAFQMQPAVILKGE